MPTPNKLNLLWQNAKLNAGAISGQTPQNGIGVNDFLLVLGADGKLHKVNAGTIKPAYNAIGNPNFEVDQRQVGTGGFTLGNAFTVDRWATSKAGLAASTLGSARAVTVLGAPGGNLITNSSIYVQFQSGAAAPAAADYVWTLQFVEGPLAAPILNTPSSLSVLCYCSQTITFCISLRDSPATKSYCIPVTIQAGQWTWVYTPNIPAMTGGNFTTAPGTISYGLGVSLATGSNWRTPTPNVWTTGTYIGVPGQTNITQLPVNTAFYLGFVQHEAGSICTAPIPVPFDQNLASCQRYYEKSYPYNILPGAAGANQPGATYVYNAASSHPYSINRFKTRMAKAPTLTGYNYATGVVNQVRNVTASTDLTISGAAALLTDTGFMGFNLTAVPAVPWVGAFHYTADTGW